MPSQPVPTPQVALIILVAVVVGPFMQYRDAAGYTVPAASLAVLEPGAGGTAVALRPGVDAFFR